MLYRIARDLVRLIYKVGWRLHVIGAENVPATGPAIISGNHSTYADPPLISVSIQRHVHFLAKKELFSFKPFGWLISNLNAHPLNRASGTEALKMALQLLNSGHLVIVFPEGGRVRTGEMGKPKPGVGMLAMKTGAPVVPAYIHNAMQIPKLKKVTVVFGEPVNPKDFKEYQELADEVMKRIALLKRDFLAR